MPVLRERIAYVLQACKQLELEAPAVSDAAQTAYTWHYYMHADTHVTAKNRKTCADRAAPGLGERGVAKSTHYCRTQDEQGQTSRDC